MDTGNQFQETQMNVGILGRGQLARMLAEAAAPLGVSVYCLEEGEAGCASALAHMTIGNYRDPDALRAWITANSIDVLTFESEFIDSAIAQSITTCRVYPPAPALAAAQERLTEKRLFSALGIPVGRYEAAGNPDELSTALATIGMPCVVKTRRGGYDGKGQVVVRNKTDIDAATALATNHPVIIEELIDFDAEISVIGVRNDTGMIRLYPLVQNEHRSGILHKSIAPAEIAPEVTAQAQAHVGRLLDHLGYVGVLCPEMFLVGNKLMGNEFAPRPHNSGHWTIRGSHTSQFENHLRAITGLPIGSTDAHSKVASLNLIGGSPDISRILAVDGASIHLYGKTSRPGRKLGHVTVLAAEREAIPSLPDRRLPL